MRVSVGQTWGAEQRYRILDSAREFPIRDAQVGIPKAGLHAFRHSRVTQLRKAGTPQDLQKQWIGHSSLRTGDRYSHTHEEVEYRRSAAGNVGLDRVLSPKQSQHEAPTCQSGLVLTPTT